VTEQEIRVTPTERARKSRKARLSAGYTRIEALVNPSVSKFMASVIKKRKFIDRTIMIETLITEEYMRLRASRKKG